MGQVGKIMCLRREASMPRCAELGRSTTLAPGSGWPTKYVVEVHV